MKRIYLLLTIILLGLSAKAQVFILNDNMFAGRLSEVRAKVKDSLTNEALAFASFYIVPVKDTTITNFTITDTAGVAKLTEVPYGNYIIHIEMMGYKTYIKEKYFRERIVDLGEIKLKQDDNFLSAIVVSDVGNPIVMKQDTIEFNASSFKVGSNAMLKDLIKKMPGMEITEEGKVTFNGEAIDRLTVGGRTFFFSDQSTALNNLPAAIVDKIRVIDRESENTRNTGVQDGSKEKILDVGLKKQYEKGWFGNAGVKGGTTLSKNNEEALRDNRGFLYGGNTLVSAYSDKDQNTFVGNVQNVNDGNAVMMIFTDGVNVGSFNQGLSSAIQLGINANTTRIKNIETTVGANYKYTDTESGAKTERITYQSSGDIFTNSKTSNRQYINSLAADVELEKETGKIRFRVSPIFRYNKINLFSNGATESSKNEEWLNTSTNLSKEYSQERTTNLSATLTLSDLWNKKNRQLQFMTFVGYSNSNGNSLETTNIITPTAEENRTMEYISDGWDVSTRGSILYAEPIGSKITLSATTSFTYSHNKNIRDAFDEFGKNNYYSSENKTHTINQSNELTIQYKFRAQSWITFGTILDGRLNETYAKSFNVCDTTGKGEWNWYIRPILTVIHRNGFNHYSLRISSNSQNPAASRMIPVLNIANPTNLSVGNIYLKPTVNTLFNGDYTYNNPKTFSSLMIFTTLSLTSKPINYVRWFDTDGIRYSIPANSKKPSISAFIIANYTTMLDKKKIWSLSIGTRSSYSATTTYQTTETLAPLDKDNFDYSTFMNDFWGDAKGNRFYSGASGFKESNTKYFSPEVSLSVKYNQKSYNMRVGASTSANISKYSLNPDLNMNTLQTKFYAEASYTAPRDWEFNSDIAYVFYKGYSQGYGKPEWQWNLEISKSIRAFNFSVKVKDILNQTHNLTHTITDNYQEDTYRLIMGRYVLFGVKWNFGKMNAAHTRKAESTAFRMAF